MLEEASIEGLAIASQLIDVKEYLLTSSILLQIHLRIIFNKSRNFALVTISPQSPD